MKKWIFALSAVLMMLCAKSSFSQDFVYTPRNPAFGGSYVNYTWMLSSAQAQNDIEAPKDDSYGSKDTDPLSDFQDNLNRQILNQLSYQLVRDQFGENGMEEGQYTMGDYEINVLETAEGISVTIYDVSTGAQTEVIVPVF